MCRLLVLLCCTKVQHILSALGVFLYFVFWLFVFYWYLVRRWYVLRISFHFRFTFFTKKQAAHYLADSEQNGLMCSLKRQIITASPTRAVEKKTKARLRFRRNSFYTTYSSGTWFRYLEASRDTGYRDIRTGIYPDSRCISSSSSSSSSISVSDSQTVRMNFAFLHLFDFLHFFLLLREHNSNAVCCVRSKL